MAETPAEFQARLASDCAAQCHGKGSVEILYRVGGTGGGTSFRAVLEDMGQRTEVDDDGTKTYHGISVDIASTDVASPAINDTIEWNSDEYVIKEVSIDSGFGCAEVLAERDETVELAHAGYRNNRR